MSPLPDDRKNWPREALEDFEERASIIEYDGKRPRDEAEKLAEKEIRDEWLRRAR